MAMDISGKPYYDRGDESVRKGYSRLAFRPDVPLQQSELNELQTLIEYYMKTSGDAIFSDGDIVSGFDFDIEEVDEGLQINFHEGAVYLDGKVRPYLGGSVIITGEGDETINVAVDSSIVTHVEDPTLLDPTIGAPSESSKGSDRVKDLVKLTANEEGVTVIFDFENGKLLVTRDKPGVDKIMDILAERTYDESGSYRVEGYELYVDTTQDTTETVTLVASAGRAYVRGYKVEKPSSTRIAIRKSTDVSTVTDESGQYNNSLSGATYQKVRLNNRPVAEVRTVTGTVEAVKIPVQRSSSSTTDTVADYANITTITAFHIGSVLTPYVQGTDYNLINGNQIQWIVGGKSPAVGSTYQITFKYIKLLIRGTDWTLTTDPKEVDANGLVPSYIDFSKSTGAKPVDGTMISTTYSFYLARKDVVRLDRIGKFSIIEGQPNTVNNVQAPTVNDPLTLPIGSITVFPNSLLASTNSETVTNIPFEQLQKVVARVSTLEYNMSTMAMDISAQQGHDPMLLRGIFSDGFNTLEKLDEGLEGTLEDGVPLNYISYSFDDAEITLPFKEERQNDMVLIPNSNESGYLAMSWGRIVTSPYKRVTLINQSQATGIMNVNPYMVFTDVEGALKLTPSNDNWIEKENIIVNNISSKTYRVNRWWRHNGETSSKDADFIKKNQDSISWDANQTPLTGGTLSYDKANPRTGTITENGGTQTIESAIEFMRQRDVTIKAEGLIPFSDNMYLSFNGVRVALTATGSTQVGSQAGTVRADAKGIVTAKFKVPLNQRCGSVDVELKNTVAVGRTSSASAIYTAQGMKRSVQTIINTTRITVKLYDPLAQSFQVPDDRIISGVGLYFQSKDPTVPVTVQIRGMSDGGQPNRTIYAEKVIQPTDVKTSTKGTAVTNVYFDDPLMAKSGDTFAIVVVTDSAEYNMFIAQMGQPLISDVKQKLTTQAYTKGVLFSSSNAQTWTAHQDSDMKFQVYATEFREGDAVVQFDVLENINMDKLLITASYLTPQNTGCQWEIRHVLASEASTETIESKPWIPAGNFIDIDPTALARKAQVRATFTANKYMSPMFALDDFSLMSFLTEMKASYVGKTVDMVGAEFDTISINYMSYEPTGSIVTSVTPKINLGETLNGRLVWRGQKEFVTPIDPTEKNTWVVTKSQPNLNGFVTVSIKIRCNKKFKAFKMRLDLATQTPVARPRVKMLRCTMTDEGNK